ncbi:MAG: hypothetical protein CMJ48_14450, partial [Planctomycetaceae bacterium]|nr:hypothetical protein [Planctomycetaceae bacterium]
MRVLIVVAALLLVVPSVSSADNWPNWRGPGQDGVAADGDYPVEWSNTKNVLWKFKLPGVGASTPVVWGDRLFLTSGDEGKGPKEGQNAALCFNREGKLLWKTLLNQERPGKNRAASGSNSSAVTDGKFVFVYFKSGDFACLDNEGKIVWQKNLQEIYGEDTLWWDLGTSPVLTSKHVVVACMQSGPSYLAAFDRATGKVVWKHDRDLGAPSEAAQSYSTPVVTTHAGRELLVVLGADYVTTHDAASGKEIWRAEIWRAGGVNNPKRNYFRSIAGPAILDGVVVAPYARGATVHGIRLGGEGDVSRSHVSWIKNGVGADVPTPVVKDGKAYFCHDRGEVMCLEVRT